MEYDPLNTMLALNMAVVSVNRILATHDRAVLEWEYTNIINRLALGNIESDPEMRGIYGELMQFITGRGLRDQERNMLSESYARREQEIWYRAISEGDSKSSGGLWNFLGNKIRKLENRIFSRKTLLSWYGNDNKYEAEKLKLSLNLDSAQWKLTKEDIEACNTLCKNLLLSSWVLLRRYGLSEEYRLTSESLGAYSRAEDEEKPFERLEMLQFIEPLFRVYPPYWYLCAEAAYEAGREDECRKFMDKFDEVWRPVLRYDPYKLEATKYRIREIASKGGNSAGRVEEIIGLLETVRSYTPPGDWSSALFAGMVYSALGEKEQGMRLVKSNVLFGYEKDISGSVLTQLGAGRFEAAKLTAGLHWLFEADLSNLNAEELKKLAERGNAEAQYRLGNWYYNAQDYTQAVYWYRKSAEQGHAWGQNNLGLMYEYGRGVDKDYTQAVYWFRKSAEQGNSNGQRYLGFMYANGWGVDKDDKQAVYWYRKSAEQGNAWGQCNLGDMYANGRGVDKDDKQAVYWYRKSAEQGHAWGQNNLGWMYAYGWGVPKDLNEARKWYQKAADQGDEYAKEALERLRA